jgi:translation elongation factor EF-1alpha
MDQFQWAQGRFDEIKKGLLPFLEHTGFSEKELVWVPIVGLSGENLKEPATNDKAAWYKGPTLLEALDQIDLGERNPDAPLRVPILDKMKVDNNLVVYGKVEAGTINIDDKLAIMPSGAPVQVLKIYDSTK